MFPFLQLVQDIVKHSTGVSFTHLTTHSGADCPCSWTTSCRGNRWSEQGGLCGSAFRSCPGTVLSTLPRSGRSTQDAFRRASWSRLSFRSFPFCAGYIPVPEMSKAEGLVKWFLLRSRIRWIVRGCHTQVSLDYALSRGVWLERVTRCKVCVCVCSSLNGLFKGGYMGGLLWSPRCSSRGGQQYTR